MTLTIEYTEPRDLVRKLRAALIEHEEWITPKEFGYRYGLMSQTLTMRLKRWRASGLIDVEAKRGPSGRTLMLKVTPDLRAKMESMR